MWLVAQTDCYCSSKSLRACVHGNGRVAQLRSPPTLLLLRVGVDITVARLKFVTDPHLLVRLRLSNSIEACHKRIILRTHLKSTHYTPTEERLFLCLLIQPRFDIEEKDEDSNEKKNDQEHSRTLFQALASFALVPRRAVAHKSSNIAHSLMLTRRGAFIYASS